MSVETVARRYANALADVVLKNGALPLEILEQLANEYIARKKT